MLKISTLQGYIERFGYEFVKDLPPDTQLVDSDTGEVLTPDKTYVYQGKFTTLLSLQTYQNLEDRYYLLKNSLAHESCVASAKPDYLAACADYKHKFISQINFVMIGMFGLLNSCRFRGQHYGCSDQDVRNFLNKLGDFLRFYNRALPPCLSPKEFNIWLTQFFRNAQHLSVIPPLFDFGVISIIRENTRYYLIVPFKERSIALDAINEYFNGEKVCQRYLTLAHAWCEATWFVRKKERRQKEQPHNRQLQPGEGTRFFKGKPVREQKPASVCTIISRPDQQTKQ